MATWRSDKSVLRTHLRQVSSRSHSALSNTQPWLDGVYPIGHLGVLKKLKVSLNPQERDGHLVNKGINQNFNFSHAESSL